MKRLLRECISISLACCLAHPAPCFGQAQATTAASTQEVKPLATREISKDDVIARFHELQQQSATIQLLDRHLRSLGFTPAPAAARYWGHTATYQTVVEGHSESLIGATYVHDYAKQNSKDGAALVHVTLTSSSGITKTDSFSLVAPNGDVRSTREYTVANNKIMLRHSWWSCMQGQLAGVGGTCAAGLVGCLVTAAITGGGTFSWATYLGCVAGNCAGAFVKAAACCAFNIGFLGCNSGDSGPQPPPPPPGFCPGNKHCCEFNAKGQCTQCLGPTQSCP